MEGNIERDCSALGLLFQQIITDLKNGTPLWEDLISKATKLHSCLKATILAISAYLDAFQRIADSATNTKGATKEIGTALTRICLRHKAVEARVKTFTSAIMDCLVTPLQEKLEDWKKSVINLDKEHSREYKKARAELKKKSTDTLRLQKKAARKGGVGGNMTSLGNNTGSTANIMTVSCGGPDLQRQLDVSMADVNERRHLLEEAEQKAACAALVEERSRYCIFVACLKPVVDEEVAMLGELTHLQEVLAQLEKHTADPYSLPEVSEQVIRDLRSGKTAPGGNGGWSFPSATVSVGGHLTQHHHSVGGRGHRGTPPSSPSSSLGSRKSSVCSSISSLNSSSSGSLRSHPSPSHHYWHRSLSQPPLTVTGVFSSSTSSGDSGFVSQDLFPPYSPYRTNNLSLWQAGISPPLVTTYDKVSPEPSGGSGGSDVSTPVPPGSCSSQENEETSSPDGVGNTPVNTATSPTSPAPNPPLAAVSSSTAATWPNLQETHQFELTTSVISGDRPHTISSAYERGHQRPPLTVYTFRPPSASSSLDITLTPGSASQPASPSGMGVEMISSTKESSLSGNDGGSPSLLQFCTRPPIPQRCSSLERPKLPSRGKHLGNESNLVAKGTEHIEVKNDGIVTEGKEGKASAEGSSSYAAPTPQVMKGIQGYQQPLYVNMNELASLAAKKAQAKANSSPHNPTPPPPPVHHQQPLATSPVLVTLSARNLPPPPPPPHAPGALERHKREAENWGDGQSEMPMRSSFESTVGVTSSLQYSPPEDHYSRPIIPQSNASSLQPNTHSQPEGNTVSGNRGTLLRRSSTQGPKPPPPIRRTSSISSTSGVAGGLAQLRSQCSPPVPQHYSPGVDDAASSAPPSPLPPPPPPLSRDPFGGESRGSLENLPPPPAFLLDSSDSFAHCSPKASKSDLDPLKDNDGMSCPNVANVPAPIPSTVSVANAVRTLTELNHQPASPGSLRRAAIVGNQVSAKPEKEIGAKGGSPTRANLIQALSAKLGGAVPGSGLGPSWAGTSPRRRHSEDFCNIKAGSVNTMPHPKDRGGMSHNKAPLMSSSHSRGMEEVSRKAKHAPSTAMDSIDSRLTQQQIVQKVAMQAAQRAAVVAARKAGADEVVSQQQLQQQLYQQQQICQQQQYQQQQYQQQQYQQQQHQQQLQQQRQQQYPKAARVRQWISSRSTPDPTVCHDSLMDQIRRGASLRRTRGVVAASECPMPQLRIDN